ncbi:homocysteine S-methyltransferase [Lophiotrema nucula]|uniref:Homocysteine S-methyltransferase n=1 Tax=Lophiotrema nucula TaxID=690887 RepID=A0A6A5ZQB3_9PLEO|nr:homocysteine S-methyltransferase [Lophiotrema nucula]
MQRSDADATLTESSDSQPTRKLSARLNSGKPIVLDGALATYLEILGADISGVLWSAEILLTNPNLIYQTHLDYYRAGANISITASYQASIPGLAKHLHLSNNAADGVVKKSVYLAKQARDYYLASLSSEEERKSKKKELFIAGSVGPYGAFLADGSEYRGDYEVPKEEMKDFHRGRIKALVEAGVDVLACETIPSFAETEALLELLRKEFPNTEAWFSFTLKDDEHISDGTSLVKAVGVLLDWPKVISVGVNCVSEVLALGALKRLKNHTSKPLIVYPNSGEEWDAEKRAWKGSKSEGSQLADRTMEYWNAGARIIGGCCRTTPKDIVVIQETLRENAR